MDGIYPINPIDRSVSRVGLRRLRPLERDEERQRRERERERRRKAEDRSPDGPDEGFPRIDVRV